MSIDTKTQLLRSVRQRRYVNKDFQSFRADLLQYARTHYGTKIQDFSEASMGGVLLDFAAFVGDVQSFYLDHQFSELFPSTAVESANIERALRESGVKIVGASPAVAEVTFFVEVPAKKVGTELIADPSLLPVILQDSVVTSDSGVRFFLTEDIDYALTDDEGDLVATSTVATVASDGSPATFALSAPGVCISGEVTVESFQIPPTFVPFRKIVLANADITEVMTVTDTLGNVYYEVDSLTQDTVFKRIPNRARDGSLVKESIEVVPAPYRYVRSMDPVSRLVTLQFGGGSAETIDDDIIPDPSEFALPLYGKKTFTRFTIDPNRLLQTRTQGVAASDTTLRVTYRHGGGLSHNVEADTIVNVTTLVMKFQNNPAAAAANLVKSSVEATNAAKAAGGSDAPSLDDLRDIIPSARNSQSRIVTREDLLARVYMMPSNFGRVFRAGLRSNPNNPLAAQLFIVSRDAQQKLIVAPDTLKKNLALFLNESRLISDAIDIMDARVLDVGLDFEVVVDPSNNKKLVVQQVISKLKQFFNVRNFQIDQPIIMSDVFNVVFNNPGVVAVNSIVLKGLDGTVQNRSYSTEQFDVRANTVKGMVVGPPGSIFEMRYPSFDIQGAAV